MAREAGLLALVWLALMLLLASTVAITFAPLGPLKGLLSLGIAVAKAGLISWVFMHLREQPGLNRIAALMAIAWLSILCALTLIDRATRGPF
jgi:cytochrome c oxidase subunit 4